MRRALVISFIGLEEGCDEFVRAKFAIQFEHERFPLE
jgi:hypothetical protein